MVSLNELTAYNSLLKNSWGNGWKHMQVVHLATTYIGKLKQKN
mgnify:CR=1